MAKKTSEFLQAHIRSQSVTLIFRVARTDCSFLRLQLNSVCLPYSTLCCSCLPPYRPPIPHSQASRKSSASCLARHHGTFVISKRHWPQCCRSAVWSGHPSHAHLIVARASVVHCPAYSRSSFAPRCAYFLDSSRVYHRCQGRPVPHFSPTCAN